jgi:hypothetical protein
MATNFPTSLDSLTNPASGDSLSSPSHSAQHANVNDAVEALQAKVGVDGSTVTSSLDYQRGMVHLVTVPVSGVTSVNLDNIFTSEFSNYRLVIRSTSASAGSYVYLRYRIGTSNLTAQYYEALRYQTFTGGGGLLTVSSGSEVRVGEMSIRGGATVDIFGPGTGQTVHTTSYIVYGAGVVTSGTGGGLNDNTSAKTGVQILAGGSTTWSGAVIAYGYNA